MPIDLDRTIMEQSHRACWLNNPGGDVLLNAVD